MPEPIDYANAQANEWKARHGRTRTALKQERDISKEAKTENAALKARVAELEAARAAAPAELQAKYDALQGEVRTTKHKAAFRSEAEKAGVRKDAVDDLFAVSGYAPEGDEPDAAKIGESVQAATKARPWLIAPVDAGDVKPPATGAETPLTQAPLARLTSVAAGGGRGALETSPGKFRVSRSRDLTDGAWVSTNRDAYRAAIKNGTLEYVD